MVLCIPISPYQYQEYEAEDAQPRQVTFNIDSALQSEEQQITTENTLAEFLSLYYKYGHLSFKLLRRMAKLVINSKKFETCDTPKYVACMYDKSICKPWRGRSRKIPHKPCQVTNHGQIVSVDQLASSSPGLVAQMTGILPTKRYKYYTLFMDHLSIYSDMHLQ